MASDSAAEFVPDSHSLRTLRQAAAGCRGCPLWRDATQTVFGAGPRKAKLMLVGEHATGGPDEGLAPVAALTIHPSAILRLREREEREEALGGLVEDLRHVAREMAKQQR